MSRMMIAHGLMLSLRRITSGQHHSFSTATGQSAFRLWKSLMPRELWPVREAENWAGALSQEL